MSTQPNSAAVTGTDIANLERATLDAVAPLDCDPLGDWLLPKDHSTIGRAKSAVPLRHDSLDPRDLRTIEARYHAWGIDASFRVADVPGLANIHDGLRAMGYSPQQPTLVQLGRVHTVCALTVGAPSQVESRPTAAWASVYTATGFDLTDGANRVRALSRSPHMMYAHVVGNDCALAAGTASLSQGWAGIHGMRTVISARGQGLAKQVLVGLAKIAAQRGFERMFLQVEEDNAAALGLYQGAGFRTAWRYHYWRR